MERHLDCPVNLPFSNFEWNEHFQTRFWQAVSQSPLDRLAFSRLNGEKLCGLLAQWFIPGSHILDFGAGGGHLAYALLNRGCNVAVIEPSQNLKSELWESILDHPLFLGFANPSQEAAYDVVVACEVIEHILPDRYEQVFAHIVQKVRTGGRLILTTPNSEDIEGAMRICPSCLQRFHPWQHVRSVNALQLVEAMVAKGFIQEFLGLIDFSNNAKPLSLGRLVERFIVTQSTGYENGKSLEQWGRELITLQEEIDGYFLSGWRPRAGRRENDPVDLRIGDEATCVFVGRKSTEPPGAGATT